MFSEMINNYGTEINYYINGFNLSAANILYGEHPTQEYSEPFVIKAYFELNEAISLTNFGMRAEDELTLYIPIDNFTTKVSEVSATLFYTQNGQRVEPKSDDLIELTALGCDRPGNRGNKIFQITEALDQSIQDGINPLMGHYVWRLKAVRFEHGGQTNAPTELGNDQVYDNTISGKTTLSGFDTGPLLDENSNQIITEDENYLYGEGPSFITTPDEKVYPFNVDTISKEEVYDMEVNDTSLYGQYYS
jgi:hypothetical protein